MKATLNQPIFFNNSQRWLKIKKTASFTLGVGFLFIGFVAYAYFYPPFALSYPILSNQEIDQAVVEINNEIRPVLNEGTFVGIERVYDEEYVTRSGEDQRSVVLSFDDGPDPDYTPKILEILKKEGIKGTFFVVGSQIYKYPKIGKSILEQGSDMGLHTFSHTENPHDNKLGPLTFTKELDFTEKLFAYHYGFKNRLFRIPYLGMEDDLSYNSLQYIAEAQRRGLTISAPTVDSFDWRQDYDTQKIVELATTTNVQTVVLLLHDSGGDRSKTIEALPQIIKIYKDRGYSFSTITDLAKANNLAYADELSPADKLLSTVVFNTYHGFKSSPQVMDKGFIVGFVFVLIHVGVFVLLALIHKIKAWRSSHSARHDHKIPLVSVIIPMYNEERSIAQTIKAILKSSYKNFELIVINDGSTDDSLEKARLISKDPRLHVLSKANGGKFSALNFGLQRARGKLTVFIDADTRVDPAALLQIIRNFSSKKVGAVAGHVRVGNPTSLLAKLQALEYDLTQGLEKRVFDLFDCVMIVPGAFGAWRTKLVRQLGGFSSETHAEDFDLTLAVIKRGYKVKYASQAIAYTEAPLTLKSFLIQRFRWNFGNLQVFYKYRSMLFNKNYRSFGLVFFPRAVFLQLPALFLTIFVDIFILLNLLIGEQMLTLWFLLFYFLMHFVVVSVAYRLEGRGFYNPILIAFYRFPYTQLLYLIVYFASFKALKGEIVAWTKLHHSGTITVGRKTLVQP